MACVATFDSLFQNPLCSWDSMNVFELTRALIDIESTTGNEKRVGSYLYDCLRELAARHAGRAERMEVAADRFNVFTHWGDPVVTLSTHIDTVPPFFPSQEDDEYIWGRGACDAKGIAASMIGGAARLLEEGARNFGLLFVVGEERNSAGALAAAQLSRGSRYLIGGEPTENKLALGSKGALRYEIVTHGRMAHSAYPELGHSAIETLLDILEQIRRIPLPQDALLGRSTLNIGTISGGRAPNVVADAARAELMFRLVDDGASIRDAVGRAVRSHAQAQEVLCTPAMRFGQLDGLPTTVVSYTTDLPFLAESWGKPFLLGPGSIHVAHTAEERVAKRELQDAVEIYTRMVRQLLSAS